MTVFNTGNGNPVGGLLETTGGFLSDTFSGAGSTVGDTLGGLFGGIASPFYEMFSRTFLLVVGMALAAWVLINAL